ATHPWGDLLPRIAEHARPFAERGNVATYIPALERIGADQFAIAVQPLQGKAASVGDADTRFSIQSISKVFNLALAMQRYDGHLWDRVGREPSGDPFNSLVQLEHERGKPRNPLINAGALVVADVLLGCTPDPRADLRAFISDLIGEEVTVDSEIMDSEANTGFRNRAMVNLMKSFGNIHADPDAVLEVYFAQCAISMTAAQLARAMSFLANDGVDPHTGDTVLSTEKARRVNALMLTCGTYDSAGEFAFRVGIPCKSGVGGGIVGVIPHQLSTCVWSPPLDEGGNSVAGRVALEELVGRTGLSLF
ncbi:MAG TPA: glutaminase, partial [Euzebya sp.]|nr:glutaminase [Euzebya sp.]